MALSSLQGVINLHNVRHPFFIWFHLHGVRDPLGHVIDVVSDNVRVGVKEKVPKKAKKMTHPFFEKW